MNYWNNPSKDVLHQRDEGAHANIISYLDELAMHQPSQRAWDELVWPHRLLLPACCARMSMLATCRGVSWNWDQLCPLPVLHQLPKRRIHLLHRGTNFLG